MIAMVAKADDGAIHRVDKTGLLGALAWQNGQ